MICLFGTISERRNGHESPTTQNHYFVATEYGHEAGPRRGRGEVGGAGVQAGCTNSLFYFRPTERNKMTEVLLRWAGVTGRWAALTMF